VNTSITQGSSLSFFIDLTLSSFNENISTNSVLDAWAKSGGGRKAAERAEEILEWMDRLFKSGNQDVRPDVSIKFRQCYD
jgi:hypothetical protein